MMMMGLIELVRRVKKCMVKIDRTVKIDDEINECKINVRIR